MSDVNDPPNGDTLGVWDRAISSRLAKLRAMPLDASRLAGVLGAQIPQPKSATRLLLLRCRLRSLAASVLIVAAVVALLMLSTSASPVLASPGRMARLHEELVSGRAPSVRVDSVETANRVLSDQWPQSPQLPDMPRDHAMACCMKSVQDKKLACVLTKHDGVRVSVVVAHRKDVRAPNSPVTERRGIRYHTESSGKLNMVMTGRQTRWVCLIGELPIERLMELADQLKF